MVRARDPRRELGAHTSPPRAALIERPGGLPDEHPQHLRQGVEFRQRPLDRLTRRERRPEGHPPPRIRDRLGDAVTRRAERRRRWRAFALTLPLLVFLLATFLVPIAVLLSCTALFAVKTRTNRNLPALFIHALEHGAGLISIDDAYMHQFGGYAVIRKRLDADPDGPPPAPVGIYPVARGAYAVLGPHTRIWSMHADSSCMLPDCKMMTFSYSIMTPAWDKLMWGTPEQGRDALRASGINYFLFSR